MTALTRRVASVAAVVVTGLSLLAIASPASAAAYDGTDPIATGCATGATTVRKAYGTLPGGGTIVEVELRYSSRCRTSWARLTTIGIPACRPGDDYCGYANVHRNSDGREYACWTPGGGHGCYTAQVNDSGVTSYAYGEADDGAQSASATTGSY
jgi:hypothetical protein